MQTTRNLFLLKGENAVDVQQVLDSLNFKGLVVLNSQTTTSEAIKQAFTHNKSVVCPSGIDNISVNTNSFYIKIVKNDEFIFSPKLTTINISDSHFDIATQFKKISTFLNCDIGDEKTNDSSLGDNSSAKKCAYCNKIYKGIDLYKQPIVYESPNFVVFPTLGQFVFGYLLIIPKQHLFSTAEFDKEMMHEFLEVLQDVTVMLELTYDTTELLIWENGTGNHGNGKSANSVVHAHVHIAPSRLTADKISKLSRFPFKSITTEEISQHTQNSYLLIKDNGSWIISDNPNVYIPRQYIRQVIAEEHNLSGELYNWRKYHYLENIQKTYDDIYRCMLLNFQWLSPRLQSRLKLIK